MRTRLRVTLALLLAAVSVMAVPPLATPPPAAANQQDDHDDAPARLLVADATEPAVSVVDLDDGDVLDRFALTGPATVYAGPGGRYGYAVQRDADVVNVVDGGVEVSDHGDHQDVTVHDPQVLDWALTTSVPTHFTPHGEQIAVFNDGDGTASIFTESSLDEGEPTVTTLDSGRAHHGVAVPLDDLALLSIPAPDEALPLGVDARTLDGEVVDTFADCPGLHGEAAADAAVAFGCSDGVLVVESHGDHFHSNKVANPDGTPEGTRVGTVRGADGVPFLLGNFGPQSLVRIDPEADTLTPLPLPLAMGGFALDARHGRALALTIDGMLHSIDPADGNIVDSVQVVDPFALTDTPRPTLTAGHLDAYVTSPADGDVIEVDLHEFEVARTLAVGGSPRSVAVLEHHDHDDEPEPEPDPVAYRFRGRVVGGPSHGDALAGRLEIATTADGAITGTLRILRRESPVTGGVVNGNLSLRVDVGEESTLFGIGNTRRNGAVHGHFVGPDTRDRGRWSARPLR